MYYFQIIFVCWLIAQSMKYVIRLWAQKTFSIRDMGKTYLYNSGFPSAHATTITGSTWYVYTQVGVLDLMFQMHMFFAYLWLFEIYMQRKRHKSSTVFFLEKLLDDKHQLKILKDLHGHDLIDILGGIILGSIIFWLFVVTS